MPIDLGDLSFFVHCQADKQMWESWFLVGLDSNKYGVVKLALA